MGSSSPPQPQNPNVTATTQQGFNTQTAIQNQAGVENQVNPYGSLSYQQTGTGPGGIPLYTSNVNFSPTEGGLYNILAGTRAGAGIAGNQLLNNANYGGSNPTTAIGNESSGIQGGLMNQWLSSQSPWLTQQSDHLKTQLENEGLMPSPTATNDPSTWGPYERAMGQLQQSQNMSVAGAASQFQPQAFQEASQLYGLPAQLAMQFAQFGQPISPTGSLVQTPQFNAQTVDYTGAVNSAQQQALQAWAAQQQLTGSMLSGLFGATGNVLGGMARGPGGLAGGLSGLGSLFA